MSAAPRTLLRSGLFRRLYLGYVALILVVTAVVGILIETRARDTLLRDFEAALEVEAIYLRDAAEPWLAPGGPSPLLLQERVARIGRETRSRLTVVGRDGTVLADSSLDPAVMDRHDRRPEILEAAAAGSGSSRRFSASVGSELLYVALAVPAAGPPLGFARAGLPVSRVEARLWELRWLVLIGAGIAALVGLLLGLVFARRLAAPVAAVTDAVESISRGGYGHVAEGRGEGEIGRLAEAVNRMSDQLRGRLETITADRNKLLAILASMVEGVVAVDDEERVVHMNAVAGRLLGVAPRDCVGRRIWEVTRAVEIPAILERTREEDEVDGRVELRADDAANPRVIELAATPLLDASGHRAGAVVVLHDITELRRLEQVRRDFVANVSHELKTPLTAIRGLVETLIDDPDMAPATARRFALKIRDQSQRLSTLVSDLLTLARVESPQPPREQATFDVRGVIRECAARIAPLCTTKSVALKVELPDTPVSLRADEEDLRQILGNLLDNAVKYTPAGGRVELRVLPAPGWVVIEVADTGIGIEPRYQDRVFERFYRVDKARSRELGGTGLGLSIVKHLVLSLDGSIGLESTPGRGSLFRVRLPTAQSGF